MATFRVSTVIPPATSALVWTMIRRAATAAAVWLVFGTAWDTPGWALAASTALVAGGVAWLTWRREGTVYVLPEDTDEYDEPEGIVL